MKKQDLLTCEYCGFDGFIIESALTVKCAACQRETKGYSKNVRYIIVKDLATQLTDPPSEGVCFAK